MKMEAYTELAKHPVFSIDDVKKHTTNGKTAYSQLDRLMKKDLVRKIWKNKLCGKSWNTTIVR